MENGNYENIENEILSLIIESLESNLSERNIILEIKETYPSLTDGKIGYLYTKAEAMYNNKNNILEQIIEENDTDLVREKKINIYDGIVDGLTDTQIAEKYGYSIPTVNKYAKEFEYYGFIEPREIRAKKNILEDIRLGLSNRDIAKKRRYAYKTISKYKKILAEEGLYKEVKKVSKKNVDECTKCELSEEDLNIKPVNADEFKSKINSEDKKEPEIVEPVEPVEPKTCDAIVASDTATHTFNVEKIDDGIIHPGHYNTEHYECWKVWKEIVIAYNIPPVQAALLLNVLKYVWRYNSKGTPLKDLKKAANYLNELIEEVEGNGSV